MKKSLILIILLCLESAFALVKNSYQEEKDGEIITTINYEGESDNLKTVILYGDAPYRKVEKFYDEDEEVLCQVDIFNYDAETYPWTEGSYTVYYYIPGNKEYLVNKVQKPIRRKGEKLIETIVTYFGHPEGLTKEISYSRYVNGRKRIIESHSYRDLPHTDYVTNGKEAS